MSSKSKQSYAGCTIEPRNGTLRLRFWVTVDGERRHVSRETGLADDADGRKVGDRLRALIGAALRSNRTLNEIDAILSPAAPKRITRGVTVAEYFIRWIDLQNVTLRKGQRVDYRRHIEKYVLPTLGALPMADIRLSDIRGLQLELLNRKTRKGNNLSVKFVKNIIAASFRAMVRDARAEDVIERDPFAVRLKWPRHDTPEPDPFTSAERAAIIEWFRTRQFRVSAPGRRYALVVHPPYHALIDLLFWSGLRPSEATGLHQGDVDVKERKAMVRRSRYLGELNAPKTRAAKRTIELFPRIAENISAILPLHLDPDRPLFVNTKGDAADTQTFNAVWYDCLRSLGIRQRGIYATKDTFVSTALADANVNIRWLEQQTGEHYATLRKHYSKWMPAEAASELRRFESIDATLFIDPTNQAVGKR